ncbi:hypothetical protein Hdeb2414_s0005g00176331 [Helianthus debilis subsp. tardiflorus]
MYRTSWFGGSMKRVKNLFKNLRIKFKSRVIIWKIGYLSAEFLLHMMENQITNA